MNEWFIINFQVSPWTWEISARCNEPKYFNWESH